MVGVAGLRVGWRVFVGTLVIVRVGVNCAVGVEAPSFLHIMRAASPVVPGEPSFFWVKPMLLVAALAAVRFFLSFPVTR